MSNIKNIPLAFAVLWTSFYLSFSATVCPCPRDIHYVCGEDAKTYMNECLAKCDSVDIKCDGNCPCKESRGEFCIAFISTYIFGCLSSSGM